MGIRGKLRRKYRGVSWNRSIDQSRRHTHRVGLTTFESVPSDRESTSVDWRNPREVERQVRSGHREITRCRRNTRRVCRSGRPRANAHCGDCSNAEDHGLTIGESSCGEGRAGRAGVRCEHCPCSATIRRLLDAIASNSETAICRRRSPRQLHLARRGVAHCKRSGRTSQTKGCRCNSGAHCSHSSRSNRSDTEPIGRAVDELRGTRETSDKEGGRCRPRIRHNRGPSRRSR